MLITHTLGSSFSGVKLQVRHVKYVQSTTSEDTSQDTFLLVSGSESPQQWYWLHRWVSLDIGSLPLLTYNHNDQAIEDCVEAAWDNEDIITRKAMGRDLFVPKAVYRLT